MNTNVLIMIWGCIIIANLTDNLFQRIAFLILGGGLFTVEIIMRFK